jgi:hypothetical protein
MARLARVEVFAADEIAIVHVMNRTVRRCCSATIGSAGKTIVAKQLFLVW